MAGMPVQGWRARVSWIWEGAHARCAGFVVGPTVCPVRNGAWATVSAHFGERARRLMAAGLCTAQIRGIRGL